MADITIRPFADGDLAAVAGLVTELGYPNTADDLRPRMARILADRDRATLVAESDGSVVGMVGVFLVWHYSEDAPAATITGMVVTQSARGKGIGARLVAAAEDWARNHGANRIGLTSHNRRSGAHRFLAMKRPASGS